MLGQRAAARMNDSPRTTRIMSLTAVSSTVPPKPGRPVWTGGCNTSPGPRSSSIERSRRLTSRHSMPFTISRPATSSLSPARAGIRQWPRGTLRSWPRQAWRAASQSSGQTPEPRSGSSPRTNATVEDDTPRAIRTSVLSAPRPRHRIDSASPEKSFSAASRDRDASRRSQSRHSPPARPEFVTFSRSGH